MEVCCAVVTGADAGLKEDRSEEAQATRMYQSAATKLEVVPVLPAALMMDVAEVTVLVQQQAET